MRINDKIEEIEKYLDEFESIIPETFEKYESNIVKKAACERYVEKIVEAIIDLAFLLIKEKNLGKPEDDKLAFDILYENKIMDLELCNKLKEAKGMRNIICHEYGKIDDEIVFESIRHELGKDTKDFLKIIEDLLKN